MVKPILLNGNTNNTPNGINDGFLKYTVTADSGKKLNITSMSISQWRNGSAAPQLLEFQVNVDESGFSQYGLTLTDSDVNPKNFKTLEFTGPITLSLG